MIKNLHNVNFFLSDSILGSNAFDHLTYITEKSTLINLAFSYGKTLDLDLMAVCLDGETLSTPGVLTASATDVRTEQNKGYIFIILLCQSEKKFRGQFFYAHFLC